MSNGPAKTTIFFDLGQTLVDSGSRTWIPGARELLDNVRGQGFPVGIISNTNGLDRATVTERYLPDDFQWDWFHAPLILLSREVKLEKPDPRIFDRAVELAKTPAANCLFLTENLGHTLVAQAQGLRVARIRPDRAADFADVASWLAP